MVAAPHRNTLAPPAARTVTKKIAVAERFGYTLRTAPGWQPQCKDGRSSMSVDDAYLNFEKAVVDLLLDGDDPVLSALRAQFQASTVKKRMFSGVGFMTDFDVPVELPRADGKSLFFLSDVCADINGSKAVAGFQVQIRNGRLKTLEGYTFSEPWPARILAFDLYYRYPAKTSGESASRPPKTRLIEQVRTQWQTG